MDTLNHGHDIEIYYGLHGGSLIFIGGGSWEDEEAASAEAKRVNAEAARLGLGDQVISPGTEAFYRYMGEAAHVSQAAEAALAHHRSSVEAARDAFRELLAGTGEDDETEK